jgi:putative oxidoreductase
MAMEMSKGLVIFSWVCKIIVAIILFQTLFFKFTGAEESKYIFSTLMGENEAVGRIGSGIVELIAVILLLIPNTAWLGALLALGTITGAIFSHLTKLGIVVKDDGGTLFILAIVVFILSALTLFLHRTDLPFVGQFFERQSLQM